MRCKGCKSLSFYKAPLFRGPSFFGLILLGLILLLYGCTEREDPVKKLEEKTEAVQERVIPIKEILTNPDKFGGKRVTIKGKVQLGLAFEYVDEQPYKVFDDTGEIWVITHQVVPKEGKEVIVSGKLVSPYQIKGRTFEIAILEEKRL